MSMYKWKMNKWTPSLSQVWILNLTIEILCFYINIHVWLVCWCWCAWWYVIQPTYPWSSRMKVNLITSSRPSASDGQVQVVAQPQPQLMSFLPRENQLQSECTRVHQPQPPAPATARNPTLEWKSSSSRGSLPLPLTGGCWPGESESGNREWMDGPVAQAGQEQLEEVLPATAHMDDIIHDGVSGAVELLHHTVSLDSSCHPHHQPPSPVI